MPRTCPPSRQQQVATVSGHLCAGSRQFAMNPRSGQWPSSFAAAAGIHYSPGRSIIPATTPAEDLPEADQSDPSSAMSVLRVLTGTGRSEGLDSPLMHAAAAASAAPSLPPQPVPESTVPSSESSRSYIPLEEALGEHAPDPLHRARPPHTIAATEPSGTPTSVPSAEAADAEDVSNAAGAGGCGPSAGEDCETRQPASVACMAPALGRHDQRHPNVEDGMLDAPADLGVVRAAVANGDAARPETPLPEDSDSGGRESDPFGAPGLPSACCACCACFALRGRHVCALVSVRDKRGRRGFADAATHGMHCMGPLSLERWPGDTRELLDVWRVGACMRVVVLT